MIDTTGAAVRARVLASVILTVVTAITGSATAQDIGACCVTGCQDTVCIAATQQQCVSLGGVYQGDEQPCTAGACPVNDADCPIICNENGDPSGACCLQCFGGSAVCLTTTMSHCFEIGGQFLGGTCTDGLCGGDPPDFCPSGCQSNSAAITLQVGRISQGNFVPLLAGEAVCDGEELFFALSLRVFDQDPDSCNAVGGQVYVTLPDGSAAAVAGLPGRPEVGLVSFDFIPNDPQVCYDPVDFIGCQPFTASYVVDSSDAVGGVLTFGATWSNLCALTDPPVTGAATTGLAVFVGGPVIEVTGCDEVCEGFATTCSATVTGGQPPYMGQWFDPSGTPVGPPCVVPNDGGVCELDLGIVDREDAGIYTIMIVDAVRCTAEDTAVLDVNNSPTVDMIACDEVCEGETAGCTVTVSGGRAPYTVEWRDPAGALIETCNLAGPGDCPLDLGVVDRKDAGTYTVTVIDGNGCMTTAMTDLVVNNLPSIDMVMCDEVCEGDPAGCTAIITGGRAPYTVEWRNRAGAVVGTCDLDMAGACPLDLGIVTRKDAGTYTITVVDGNMCTFATTVDLVVNNNPSIDLIACDEVCEGETAGCTVTVSGGRAPYTVEWRDPGGALVGACNLPGPGTCPLDLDRVTRDDAGTYTVTVIDANMCMATGTADLVVENGPSIDVIACDEVCEGETAGCTVTVSGGRAPYTVEWFDPGGALVETCNLPGPGACPLDLGPVTREHAGTYMVTVTDSNMCTTTGSADLVVNNLPSIDMIACDEVCEGETAGCTVTVSGGRAPYTVEWRDPSGTVVETCTLQMPGVCPLALGMVTRDDAGTYTVTVIDDNMCMASDMADLVVNNAPTIDMIGCSEVCEGNLAACTVSVSGGRAPYTVEWRDPAGTLIETCDLPAAGDCPLDLGIVMREDAGLYTVTVIDANACTATGMTELVVANGAVIDMIGCDEACENDPAGCTVSVSGGRPPYVVEWRDPAGTLIETCNLPGPGTCPLDLGIVTRDDAGTYTVTVTDDNMCVTTDMADLVVNNNPSIDMIECDEVCEGDPAGCTVSVSGGRAPYTVEWRDPSGAVVASCDLPAPGDCPLDLGMVTRDDAGTYMVTVIDANMCMTAGMADLVVNNTPVIDMVSCDEVCEGNPAACTASISGGRAPYLVEWRDPAGAVIAVCNLPAPAACPLDLGIVTREDAGVYTVSVTDGTMCTATVMTELIVDNGAMIDMASCDEVCEGDPAGCTATVSGGRAPYVVEWRNPAGTLVETCTLDAPGACPVDLGVVDRDDAGIYTVTVIDANGCVADAMTELVVDNGPAVTLACGGDPLELCATVAGARPPFAVEFYDASGALLGSCQVDTSGGACCIPAPRELGTFTAVATDANGCPGSDTTDCDCPTEGNCFNDQGPNMPGCEDPDCCALVCSVDPFCCEVTWDVLCAQEALQLCGMCGELEAGDCFEPNGTPGCNDFTCCQLVCEIDAACCHIGWDEVCANLANDICNLEQQDGGSIRDGRWFDADTWAGTRIPGEESRILIRTDVSVDRFGAVAGRVRVVANGRLSISRGSLTADRVSVRAGGTLRLDDASAVLTVRTLVLEAGAVLEWHAGRIEIAGGALRHAGPALVVDGTDGAAELHLSEGATAAVTRLIVGVDGEGIVAVSSGATLLTGEAIIGVGATGSGEVLVADASCHSEGPIDVGVDGAATLTVLGDGVASASDLAIGSLGTISGNGRIESPVFSSGTTAPGDGLLVDGGLVQSADGVLLLHLAPEGADLLHVSAGVELSGTLQIQLADGYVPVEGDSFVIVTHGGRRGCFTAFAFPALTDGLAFRVSYGPDRVTASVVAGEAKTPAVIPTPR